MAVLWLGKELSRTMQNSNIRYWYWNVIRRDFCPQLEYNASPKRWLRHCLRYEWLRLNWRHSFTWGTSIHTSFSWWRSCSASPKWLYAMFRLVAAIDLDNANIPPSDPGLSYTQVSAGACHTILLRSDGHAVVFGLNEDSATFHHWMILYAGSCRRISYSASPEWWHWQVAFRPAMILNNATFLRQSLEFSTVIVGHMVKTSLCS